MNLTASRCADAVTRTDDPSGANFDALPTRLREGLVDALFVAIDVEPRTVARFVDRRGESLPFLSGDGLEHIDHLREQRGYLVQLGIDDQTASFDAREVEQVADQAVHPLCRALDG